MTRPINWLNPATSFPLEIDETVRHISAIRREFLITGMFAPDSLRSTIQDSWQRCAKLIGPERTEVPVTISSDAGLLELISINKPFLKAAGPVIERLSNFLSGSGYIIGLADPKSQLLQVNGDKLPVTWLEHVGLIPGGNWSEAAAGTNGIGTALAVGHAVQVVGPEHYCDGWQDLTCISVPIRTPWNGEIVGVLDISGDYHLVRPFFTGILAAAALEIKQNLSNLNNFHQPESTTFHIAMIDIPAGVMTGITQTDLVCPAVPKSNDDIQSQIEFHARRAFAAERLALAAGTVNASLDIQRTLLQVTEQAAHLFELDSAAACIFDESGEAILQYVYARSKLQEDEIRQGLKTILDQNAMICLLRESSEPVTVDDVSVSPEWSNLFLKQSGVSSFAILPLQGMHNLTGFIFVPQPVPVKWQADDLRLGLTFSFHAGSALENARMFEILQQHQRHIEELNAVNQILNTIFDPAQHLPLIIERIVSILNFDAGLILLYQKSGDDPLLAAQFGLPEALILDLFDLPRYFLQEKAVGNTQICASIMLCERRSKDDFIVKKLKQVGLCDVMIAGLTAGNELLGYILVGIKEHRKLTDENLTLFTNIGQQLGLALKNAQLSRSVGEMEAMREADRIKSRFLMTVSHDLRSPLTAIRTSVESLLEQAGLQSSDNQAQLLGNIAGQAHRLTHLVDQLLDLSRIEAGALTLDRDWTELGALISDTVLKFNHLNSHQIHLCLANDLPLVYIDPYRIIQVLWNLLENANKYSPSNTPIKIETFWKDEKVLIHISDQGPGIPEEERELIFQYFYRLDRDSRMHTPGSGLGLAICRGIMETHGGWVWVEAAPGGGSTFCVVLPPPSAYPDSLKALEGQEPSVSERDVTIDPLELGIMP
ncbi:MAG: ATP-binding protein [Chloroflexi bacterium]|nr:ATP-binding protein [Chloroflexota bacterium]